LSSQARFIDKEIRLYHLIPRSGCLLLAGLAALACTAASVTDGDSANTTSQSALLEGNRPGNPHRPPQAAFDACAKLAAGATCQVSLHDRTFGGTCRKGPDGNTELACVPPRTRCRSGREHRGEATVLFMGTATQGSHELTLGGLESLQHAMDAGVVELAGRDAQ
jgi:hypothetical protein